MSSKRGDADRRDELLVERRLSEALADTHPDAEDPETLREKIWKDSTE